MEHFYFSQGGREWNEDRAYSCEDFAFVLDGATSLYPEKYSNFSTDAEWYSNWWCEFLKVELHNKKITIPEILKNGLKKVTKEYLKLAAGNPMQDFPSCTVSIVRRNNGNLEIYSLTDSSIVIKAKTGLTILIQDPLNYVKDAFVIMKIKDLAEKDGISLLDSRKKYGYLVQDGRQKKNKFGGYYVLSNEVAAVEHGIYSSVEENIIDKVLILSDGYSQVFDVVKFLTAEKLIDKVNSLADVEKIYKTLKTKQYKDLGGEKYLRFKVSDDASLAYLKFD